MGTLLMAGWLLAGATAPLASAPDTTVELRRGDRVVVERFTGEVSVESWSRSSLSVAGADDDVRGVTVTRSGSDVTVRPDDRKARTNDVDLVVRVPAWVRLEISGRELDVSVSGVEGGVTVRNVSGDVRLDRVGGDVAINTVEGEIGVYGARGPVTAHSRGDDVTLSDVTGDVDVASGDVDLRLENVAASKVRAETLDGDVYFSGALAREGTYWVSVHDGDATLVLPGSTDAHVSVSTFDGELTSDFPVTLRRYQGGGVFDFTLGQGSAQLVVKVFDGEIRIRRQERR